LAGDIEAVLKAIKTLQQTLKPLSPEARASALAVAFPDLAPAQAAEAHTDMSLKLAKEPMPIAPILEANLVMLAKAFAKAAGVKITTVGTNSTKTASFYVELASGERSCTLRTYDKVTGWFASNWPEEHEMPTLEDPEHYTNREVQNVEKAGRRKKLRKPKSATKKTSATAAALNAPPLLRWARTNSTVRQRAKSSH
jgi:hypothetical protein